MDLGIGKKNAIVCASSRGLGRACAVALAREGVNITLNGRDETALQSSVELCAAHGVEVQAVVGDMNAELTRAALLKACPQPDILVTNNGGPPPGVLKDWDHRAWIGALESNMITHILMIRVSTGARAGLTSVCKALSAEVAYANVTINNLLPERIDTDRQKFMASMQSERQGISMDEAYAQIAETIAAKRLGKPEEFGDACAYLCSAQAGFISGQNLQIDGGSYEGLI